MTEYQTLLVKFQPRPISSAARYARMLKQIEQLMDQPHNSRAEHELLEVLATLVEQYESKRYPSPDVSPEEMLAHCIAARNTTAAQVAKDTEISPATLSNVLAGRRGISKANALKLGSYFNLPPSVFVE